VNHAGYLVAAYGVIFLVIGGYLAFMRARGQHLKRELDRIEQRIASLKSSHSSPPRTARM
jgi:CcmD family protein